MPFHSHQRPLKLYHQLFPILSHISKEMLFWHFQFNMSMVRFGICPLPIQFLLLNPQLLSVNRTTIHSFLAQAFWLTCLIHTFSESYFLFCIMNILLLLFFWLYVICVQCKISNVQNNKRGRVKITWKSTLLQWTLWILWRPFFHEYFISYKNR